MKDEATKRGTKRSIRNTVIFLILLILTLLGMFVFSVIQQGPTA